jgi:hypothetical protein
LARKLASPLLVAEQNRAPLVQSLEIDRQSIVVVQPIGRIGQTLQFVAELLHQQGQDHRGHNIMGPPGLLEAGGEALQIGSRHGIPGRAPRVHRVGGRRNSGLRQRHDAPKRSRHCGWKGRGGPVVTDDPPALHAREGEQHQCQRPTDSALQRFAAEIVHPGDSSEGR